MPPRIAIPVPTTSDLEYNRRNWPAYAKAVSAAGAEPVEVPLDLPLRSAVKVAESCDGFLLPGSPADVLPSRYGCAPEPATAPPDTLREAIDTLLCRHAIAAGKPLLGVCYGSQLLNVLFEGTLRQDLPPQPIPHAAGPSVGIAHTVLIAPDALLASLVDPVEATLHDGVYRLSVNSSHHQSVAHVGRGLRVSATCPQDGVVEAIESVSPGLRLLAVQWHPERSVETSATSRNLFTWLAREAARRNKNDHGSWSLKEYPPHLMSA